MSDKEILDIFITKKGKINPNLCRDRWLDKHLDIKEYLDSQKVMIECNMEILSGILH